MGRVVVDERAIEREMFDEMVSDLDAIGREAKAFCRRETPRRTGFAQDSIFYVVLAEDGTVIAGDTHDGNGERIPNYLPGFANGTLRVFVGANAPYYIWIEIGANGRPGHQALARTAELMEARQRQLAAERRQLGRAA